MAGGLKCSSRDLTLEFAGNRTGLRGPKGVWGVANSVCVCVFVCWRAAAVFALRVQNRCARVSLSRVGHHVSC